MTPHPAVTFPPVDPVVSVVILAVRNVDLLAASLRSLHDHAVGGPPFEVVVVLNDAVPEVEAYVDSCVRGVTVIRSHVNLGTGGGFNRAFARARGRYLTVAHDDSEVTPGWLLPLVDTLERNPDAAAAGGRVVGFDGRLQGMGRIIWRDGRTDREWLGDAPAPEVADHPRSVDYHGGLGLLIRREAWEAVAGFDDVTFYPAYNPDADLCIRWQERGWRVLYDPRSTVLHHGQRSTTSHFRAFLGVRNTRLLGRLHEEWLASHGPPAPDDADAIRCEVERAARCPVGPVAPGPMPEDLALLAERLDRSDLEYLRLERDVWRDFAASTVAELGPAEQLAVQREDAWRQSRDDAQGWRDRADALERALADSERRRAATHRELDTLVSSRWWRFGRRARRLLGRP